jgi:hypothetical protein
VNIVFVHVFVAAVPCCVLCMERKNGFTGGRKYEFLCSNVCINAELVVLMLHSSRLQEKSCGRMT